MKGLILSIFAIFLILAVFPAYAFDEDEFYRTTDRVKQNGRYNRVEKDSMNRDNYNIPYSSSYPKTKRVAKTSYKRTAYGKDRDGSYGDTSRTPYHAYVKDGYGTVDKYKYYRNSNNYVKDAYGTSKATSRILAGRYVRDAYGTSAGSNTRSNYIRLGYVKHDHQYDCVACSSTKIWAKYPHNNQYKKAVVRYR